MKVLFICPYPVGTVGSQRFRFEQYFQYMEEEGIEYDVQSFLNERAWRVLYKPGHHFTKLWGFLGGMARRKLMLLHLGRYDYVFLHREAAPLFPPVFEWIICKLFGKKLIYDFDDAIWLSNASLSNRLVAGLKAHGKVASICKWAHKVSCGNEFLANYARQFNSNVIVNPTTIDTENLHNRLKDQRSDKVVIGWTGSHSTLAYLEPILEVIKKLREEFGLNFQVIADRKPELDLEGIEFKPWRKETEIEDLMQFNIGIMPVPDTAWSRGKCGFKLLQYGALGIPAVASPVGINKDILENGVNGYLAASADEWENQLRRLITDQELRNQMGLAAREEVTFRYSAVVNRPLFFSLFA